MGRSQVGLTRSPHASVAPGLAGSPLHRVIAVLDFLEQGVVVVAFGLEAGAAVLAQHHVAVSGEEPHGMVRGGHVVILAVGAPIHQDWEATRGVGTKNVGSQARAVPHGNHDVAFANYLELPFLCHAHRIRRHSYHSQ